MPSKKEMAQRTSSWRKCVLNRLHVEGHQDLVASRLHVLLRLPFGASCGQHALRRGT